MTISTLVGHLRGADFSETVKVIESPLWWHEQGLTKTATGYGTKIESPYKVEFNNRLYRVYYNCYSNVASHYIVSKGERLFFTMVN